MHAMYKEKKRFPQQFLVFTDCVLFSHHWATSSIFMFYYLRKLKKVDVIVVPIV